MSTPSHVGSTPWPEDFQRWIPDGAAKPVPVAIAFFLLVLTWLSLDRSQSHLRDLPLVNPPKSLLQSTSEIKKEFLHTASALLSRARALYPGKPYRIMTNLGPMVVLPPQFAEEIRNSPELDFMAGVYKDFHGNIPGFQGISAGFASDGMLTSVVRKYLTKALSKVTEPIAEEASRAILLNLGEATDWQAVNLHKATLDIISRVSTRVFLGEDMCRNEEWLRITKTYTIICFQNAARLGLVPPLLRPVVHWLMPGLRHLRALCAEAEALVWPVIHARRELKARAAARGAPGPRFDDCVEWAEAEAAAQGRPYDPCTFQLNVSVAAVHTTTDLMTRIVLDLADRPALVEELRAEVCRVLRAEGWTKTSLQNMKLMDSAIKESQRLKPISSASMRRLVIKPLTLSNGVRLRPGDRLTVDAVSAMMDARTYEQPATYDAHRFLRWREQPGRAHRAHLVATSAEHLGFGHGAHACPGRFFAATEVKVVLCLLLLQYDWALAPGTSTAPRSLGMALSLDPATQLLFRRRAQPELDIASL